MNQAPEGLEQFKRDTVYYETHREELVKQYPEQWVAIFREQVVATALSANME